MMMDSCADALVVLVCGLSESTSRWTIHAAKYCLVVLVALDCKSRAGRSTVASFTRSGSVKDAVSRLHSAEKEIIKTAKCPKWKPEKKRLNFFFFLTNSMSGNSLKQESWLIQMSYMSLSDEFRK